MNIIDKAKAERVPEARVIVSYPVGQPAALVCMTMDEAVTIFDDAIEDWKSDDFFTIQTHDCTMVFRSSDVLGIALVDIRGR